MAATDFETAVSQTITSSNQLHEVINGTSAETVTTDSGEIPTLRKSLVDNFYFLDPLPWTNGVNEEVFNQIRDFEGLYYYAPTATTINPVPLGVTPIGDNNWVLSPFASNVAEICSNTNLLSNHNFIIQSPDDSQPPPSATPTTYPPGFQIFSGVFANETTGITNLTYVDGRVSFSGGDFYIPVANTGAIERLTDFVTSVADFDGKPRTRGVSFALVGDEYRVTVGVDALEDASANPTPLGSVKFEQGGVATRHEGKSLFDIYGHPDVIGYADVRAFGAKYGQDSTQSFIDAQNASDEIFVSGGEFELSNLTITSRVRFGDGGLIKPGTGLVIEGEIDAGYFKIFNSNQDFTSASDEFVKDTNIKIRNQPLVIVDWFGAERAMAITDIKTVPDSSNFIHQAIRAAGGNYIANPSRPGNFVTEFSNANIGLGNGYYNLERQVKLGVFTSGASYWADGIGMKGVGISLSYLIASEKNFGFGVNALQFSYFQGQANSFRDFKVSVYVPGEVNPFKGEFPTMAWFGPGDSAQINNLWASGAQTGADLGQEFLRDGVGFQFQSCIDVQGSNVFSEQNIHNYAIYSSSVSISNQVSFSSGQSNVIFGIPAQNFSYPQGEAKTILNLNNAEWKASDDSGILVVEAGSKINSSNVTCDGTEEGTGNASANDFVKVINDASISGSINGLTLVDFVRSLARSGGNGRIGRPGETLSFNGGTIKNMTSSDTTNFPGVISTGSTTIDDNSVTFTGFGIDVCNPQLAHFKGDLNINDINLKSFRGVSSNGDAQSLVTIQSGNVVHINDIKRENDNSLQISQIGFFGSGLSTLNNLEGLDGVTMTVGKGAGAEVKKFTVVDF